MGNTSSTGSGHKVLINVKEPLSFHSTHSDHIRILNDGRTAQRVESFCKGICFSARPIAVNEYVSIKCSHISTNWSGFLRVGFTANNPSMLISTALPRYACPDMTNQAGNWAKALPERFGVLNNVITYSVNRMGDVHIALNGEPLPGPFFTGVNVSQPLWALIDIYGNATGVEFVDTSLITPPAAFISSTSDSAIARRHHRKSVPNPLSPTVALGAPLPSPSTIPVTSPSRHHARVTFAPLHFHATTGKSVGINAERSVATRQAEEYANAYIFTERPLNLSEKIVIQVLAIDASFTGGLTVGITACDPLTLSKTDFPDDSDHLLDRPEYWVVHKDVVTSAEVGDELSFTFSTEGEIQFARNSNSSVVIMHIDKTIPVWLFWDLYGQFSQIKLFGSVLGARPKTRTPTQLPPPSVPRPQLQARSLSVQETSTATAAATAASLTVELPPVQKLTLVGAPPIPPRLQKTSGAGATNSGSVSSLNTDSLTANSPIQVMEEEDESSQNMANECTVCFERACDCVIYTCGHMCMCYDCALTVKASPDPLCPICRQNIVDIIRIYKS